MSYVDEPSPPGDAPLCTASTTYKGEVLICERSMGHPGDHNHGKISWRDPTPPTRPASSKSRPRRSKGAGNTGA